MSETRILIQLLRIYFPRISEFGPASEFRGAGAGVDPQNPPRYATAQRDCKKDISTHVDKLQKKFVYLNDELAKHGENTFSERTLTGIISSTLGKEYDNFKYVWDTISTSTQTVNLLIEKLCAIELRADKLASAKATALVAHENDRTKSNSMKVNSSNSMKKEADSAKQKITLQQVQTTWSPGCGVS
jgi:hypothetical protein